MVLVALGEALVHILSQVGRNLLAELLNVGSVDGLGKAKRGLDNFGIESEEVLGNLAGTGILGVQGSDESSIFAVVVELEVDGALRENGAFELVEVAGDFRVVAGLDEAVLKHIAELEVVAFDQSEELGGAGVYVRSVDAARPEETNSGANAEVGKNGKGLDVLWKQLVRNHKYML